MLRFQTNKRVSQWYGSGQETLRKVTAPVGYYIHMIHGSNKDGALRNVDAYFVPLSLRKSNNGGVWVADSEAMGDVANDLNSGKHTGFGAGNIRAVVIQISDRLQKIRALSTEEYWRYLAVTVTENPLKEGEHVLVFAENERIIAIRGCLIDGQVSSIQFDTTHRTSEWVDPVPSADSVVETRSIADGRERLTLVAFSRWLVMITSSRLESASTGR